MTNFGTIAGSVLWSAIALMLAFVALEPITLDAPRAVMVADGTMPAASLETA